MTSNQFGAIFSNLVYEKLYMITNFKNLMVELHISYVFLNINVKFNVNRMQFSFRFFMHNFILQKLQIYTFD